MTTVSIVTKPNPDGTLTYTVKCGLEEVHDINGDIVDNPIQTLFWNQDEQRYVLYLDTDPPESGDEKDNDNDNENDNDNDYPAFDDIISETISVDVGATATTSDDTTTMGTDTIENNNNDNNSTRTHDILLARECWCARIFHNGYGMFDSRYGGDDDESTSILDIPKNPLFCPLDTNADQIKTNRDVKVCTARAVIDLENKNIILAQESICYQEEALSEFSKSAWPLCFFWWIILFYILWGTQYGRRVRGYVWRMTCIQANKLKKHKRQQNNNTENDHGQQDDDNVRNNPTSTSSDEEQGGGTDQQTPPTPQTRSNTSNNNNNNNDFTTEELNAIEEEFGSLQNYNLLDHELRYQAEHTDNEFVTWLWYSAVYTEVRRYRYEQWVARRERQRRRRRQQLAGANQAAFNGDENSNNDDDSSEEEAEVDLMRGRRLDSVFWWPPSSPDGTRWEHVRNRTQNGRTTHDENGNPIDLGRLRLKTKIFSLLHVEESAQLTTTLDTDKTTNTSNTNTNTSSSDTEMNGEDKSTFSESKPPMKNVTDHNNNNNNNNNNNDENELLFDEIAENTCSICLCELEEGDVVGDIPCGHVFHKDCLKEWLFKNNHCPICRMPNIAYHPVHGQTISSSTASMNS